MKRYILAFIIVLFVAFPVWADTHYVSKSGTDDAGHGGATGTDAWLTLNYALTGNRVAKGDTVIVEAGTYEEAKTTLSLAAGTGGVTTIQAATGETVIFNIPASAPSPMNFYMIDIPTKWVGFTFTDTRAAGTRWFQTYNDSVGTPLNTTFEYCTFDGFVSGYEVIYPTAESGCTNNVYITKSTLKDITGAISVSNGGGIVNLYMHNNLITNANSIQTDGLGISYGEYFNNTITFLSAGTGCYGFWMQNAGSSVKAYNNIIVGYDAAQEFVILTDAVAADVIATPARFDIDYNIFWSAEATIDVGSMRDILYYSANYSLPIKQHNRFFNPSFTTWATDLTLTSSSYASGKGSASNHPTDNLDRNGSAFGANDVGCYVNPASISFPTVVSGKVVFFGDSIMMGTGSTGGNTCYEQFAALVPSATVVGGTGPSLGGSVVRSAITYIDHVMQTYTPATVFVSIGVNDMNTPKTNQTNAEIVTEIISILTKISSYGAIPIWLGVESIIGNPPDNTSTKAVNAAVLSSCTTNGWLCGSILTEMEKNANWKADYYADLTTSLHPDNDGHSIIANLAKDLYPVAGNIRGATISGAVIK